LRMWVSMLRISFPEIRKILSGSIAAIIFLVMPFIALSAAPDQELAAIRGTGETFVRISRKITPSVVNIRTYRKVVSRSETLSVWGRV